jgi:O-antigen ligase
MNEEILKTPVSVYVCAVLLSAVSGAAVAFFDQSWGVLVFAAAILFVTVSLVRLPWGAYLLLIISLLSALRFEIGPVHIRPDQIVTVLLSLICIAALVSRKQTLALSSLDWLILAYLFCNVFSSFLHSPDLRMSLQRCLLLTVTFASYFVVTQLIRTPNAVKTIFKILIVAGVLEAFYGILSVLLITKGVHTGGAYYTFDDIYATGTFQEGNIYGSFEMMISLILVSFLLNPHFRKQSIWIVFCLIAVLIASVMSFTRAAWLGFAAGCGAFLIFDRKRILTAIKSYLPLILGSLILLLVVGYTLSVSIQRGSVSLMTLYQQRVERLLEYKSGSGSDRVRMWQGAYEYWKRNPWFGNGTDSIKVLARGSSLPVFGEDYWIPNSLLLALHDTGLVGFFCFCLIQLVFLWNVRSAMKRTSDPFFRSVLGGFFAAFVGVQIAYIFTNAFWLIFIWVFMAIGICCSKIAVRNEVSP